ncbi:AAA family ATPase [Blastopirellula retiformator]|uniref:AAA family ATPase n=1 Tax=Blastopirellula retiformator TaxID=2527970 RepID=UPI0036F3E692
MQQPSFENQSCVEAAPSRTSQPETAPSDSPLTSVTTAQMFARRRPPAWLLPGMLRQHQAAVLLGPSRCLKSSIAIDLAGALATGGTFLGQFAAERAFRVGFVAGEATRDVAVDLTVRWASANGTELESLERLTWSFDLASLDGPANLRRLSDWIERHKLEVVLIDAADLLAPTRRGAAAQLRDLVRCIQNAGATPIFCCPLRKEPKPRPLGTADLAGDPCDAIARQWILVNRREAFVPGSGAHRLWLTYGGSGAVGDQLGVDIDEGAAGDAWQVTPRDLASIRAEEADQIAADQAEHLRWKLRAVLKRVDPLLATKLKIRELSGMNGGKFAATWDRMVADGEIVPIRPRYAAAAQFGEPCYRLADGAEKKEASRVHSPLADDNDELQDRPEKNEPRSPLPSDEPGFVTLTCAELLALDEAEQKKAPPSPVPTPRQRPRQLPKKKKRRR